MNYSQSLRYLDRVRETGTKLSLQNIQNIINNLPLDLNSIHFIQVAGTNGKGSTAHFITSILKRHRFRVGLFTSPHLENMRERITVDKKWISRNDFAQSLSLVRNICRDLLKKGKIENMPTYFEHLFLTAIVEFKRKNCRYSVLEVGLGGRLDATSTIRPAVTVITNISYDHTKTLGKRIADIAYEKGSIIKRDVPIVCGCSGRSRGWKVIRTMADERNAPFYSTIDRTNQLEVSSEENGHYLCRYQTADRLYHYTVTMNGIHQAQNAAIAVKAAEVLEKMGHPIKKRFLEQGISDNFVPGRIEQLGTDPPVIIDGGHNVAGIQALADFLEQRGFCGLTLIFGVLRDKKYRKMAALLSPFIQTVILTEPDSKRALPAETLVPLFAEKTTVLEKDYAEALRIAKQSGNGILITGSLYLIGEMRHIILLGG